jgi:hypothetical protein
MLHKPPQARRADTTSAGVEGPGSNALQTARRPGGPTHLGFSWPSKASEPWVCHNTRFHWSLFCSGGEILAVAVFAIGIPWSTGWHPSRHCRWHRHWSARRYRTDRRCNCGAHRGTIAHRGSIARLHRSRRINTGSIRCKMAHPPIVALPLLDASAHTASAEQG